ncbi:MAG: PEGA domain-containing protein [Persicimonas sp.]
MLAFIVLVSPSLTAADDGARGASSEADVVLWALRGPDLSEEALDQVRDGLESSLSDESGRHLFGEKAFRDYVADSQAPLPDCLRGLEACEPAGAMVLEALDISLVVRVDVEQSGEGLVGRYKLIDRRGEVTGSEEVEANSPRELAFELAGDIFDATATLSVQTEPEGATVEVGGDEIGRTPVDTRLPLGEHDYSITLDGYVPVEESVDLRDAGGQVVRHELEVAPAELVVEGAPEGATVVVNGREVGSAGERIELEPGHHALEVQADGHESYRDTVRLEAGEVVERDVTLEERHPLLQTATPREITANSYIGRIAFDFGLHRTSFRGARGNIDDTRFEFGGFGDDPAERSMVDESRRMTRPHGLRLDFSYSWENIGLVLLSMSYTSSNLALPALLESSDADEPVSVEVTDMSRLQLRPLQLGYRYFFDNIAPFAEIGAGINIQWIRAEGERLDEAVRLSDSEAFWTLGLGVSYFVTPNVFATLRYSGQFYFDRGLGAESLFSLGAGLALPNLFGFEPEPPDQLE